MKTPKITHRWLASWQLIAVLALTGGSLFAKPHYTSTNLDSDIPGVAAYTDSALINPWGVVTGVAGNLHVADEATGVSTLYSPTGDTINFTGTDDGSVHAISIPFVSSTIGAPTGVVDNQQALLLTSDSNDFPITSGGVTRNSHFLFCTEDGVIAGFNPSVSATAAITGTSVSGAGFTGLSLSYSGTEAVTTGTGLTVSHTLFAADFANGKIDVFNSKFVLVTSTALGTGTTAWNDKDLPTPPAGYAWSPFNIHTLDFFGKALESDTQFKIRHLLLVTIALHSTSTNVLNDVPETNGTNNGIVAIFNTEGTYIKQLGGASHELSSPWGVAVSHGPLPDFGAPIVVLIGSHGTGTINAYAIDPRFPDLDKHLGVVTKDDEGDPLAIDGLWGLRFADFRVSPAAYIASGGSNLVEDTNHFYFSAGLLNETHGLLGKITKP
jgi:uncharacterized protein (TIGR03118 family)